MTAILQQEFSSVSRADSVPDAPVINAASQIPIKTVSDDVTMRKSVSHMKCSCLVQLYRKTPMALRHHNGLQGLAIDDR